MVDKLIEKIIEMQNPTCVGTVWLLSRALPSNSSNSI